MSLKYTSNALQTLLRPRWYGGLSPSRRALSSHTPPPAQPQPGDPVPVDVTFGDVSMAMFRIRSGIHRTEVHHRSVARNARRNRCDQARSASTPFVARKCPGSSTHPCISSRSSPTRREASRSAGLATRYCSSVCVATQLRGLNMTRSSRQCRFFCRRRVALPRRYRRLGRQPCACTRLPRAAARHQSDSGE